MHGRQASVVAVVVARWLLLVVDAVLSAITGLERDERSSLLVRLHRSAGPVRPIATGWWKSGRS
jgi:hypothetical protein